MRTVACNLLGCSPHAGEQPKRLHAMFRTRRKLEIKNMHTDSVRPGAIHWYLEFKGRSHEASREARQVNK
jgi:hypothetical protein